MRIAVLLAASLALRAETLHYVINWPSGLSLGEATLSSEHPKKDPAQKTDPGWTLDFDLDASIPGFAVGDHYHSTAGPDLCSSVLDKKVHRGSKKTEEQVTFHQDINTITRETKGPGGGKSDVSVGACARDALSFIQFARNELAQGRIAPQQSVVLGGLYNVRLTLAGTQSVKMNGQSVQADKIQAAIKGPASEFNVEIFFARDAARTPALIRIPLSLGTFTAELTH